MASRERADTEHALRQKVSELLEFDAQKLMRSELGVDLDFSEGLDDFERVKVLYGRLTGMVYSQVPFDLIKSARTYAEHAISDFRDVLDFTLAKHPENPVAKRNEILKRIRDRYRNHWDNVVPMLTFADRDAGQLAALQREASTLVTKMREFDADLRKSGERIEERLNSLVAETESVARQAGISVHATHFEGGAKAHDQAAGKWLTATTVLAAVSFVFTLASGIVQFVYLRDLSGSQALQISIAKLLVLTVLFASTVWAGRIYRAHQHNSVVNWHRQRALGTFRAFAEATSDPAIKNQVLLEATRCIFMPQASGYSPGDGDVGYPQIIETVRTLAQKN